MICWLAFMIVVLTGSRITVVIGTEVSNVSVGRDTVRDVPAEAIPLARKNEETATASVKFFQVV